MIDEQFQQKYSAPKSNFNSKLNSTVLAHLTPGPQWIVLECDGTFIVEAIGNFGICHSDLKPPRPPPPAETAAAAAVSDTLITYSELFGGTGSESDIMSSSININSDISSVSYLLLFTVSDCGISGAATGITSCHKPASSCPQHTATVAAFVDNTIS